MLLDDLRKTSLANALTDEQLADFASIGGLHEYAAGRRTVS